jgi:transposase InsO family protein
MTLELTRTLRSSGSVSSTWRFVTRAEAQLAVFEYLEGWYNPRRRHSALDYLSPIASEKRAPERG